MHDASRSAPADEFFIGWLKMPQSYARLLGIVTPLTVMLGIGIAAALPLWQQSAGSGTWAANSIVTVEGVLQAEPYALLRTLDGSANDRVRAILLVEEGKFGAHERALPLEGQYVRAKGTFLHRDGRWMLELRPELDSLVVAPAASPADLQRLASEKPRIAGPVTLQGEIIDPKCYLGAMQPGGGKTHKACAILCISGGIPPMLITRDGTGSETFYLLTDSQGASAKDCVLKYVGDVVELKGGLQTLADLQIVRVDPASIRRL